MIVFPVCGLMVFAVVYLVMLVLVGLFNRFKNRRVVIAAVVLSPVGLIVSQYVAVTWFAPFAIRRGENCDISQFDVTWPKLPANASDITYYSDLDGCRAVFHISDSDFRSWVIDNQWIVTPLAGNKDVSLPSINKDFNVSTGIEFFSPPHTGTIRGVYDSDKQLCGFWTYVDR